MEEEEESQRRQHEQQRLCSTYRFRKIYTAEEMEHYRRSKYVAKFLERKGTACKASGVTYSTQLRAFAQYIYHRNKQGQEVDDYIDDLKKSGTPELPYDELAAFGSFLQKERRGESALSANSRRLIIKTAKQFMRFSRVPVNNEDFRDFVSLPRQEQQDRRPITKREIIELLNGAKDARLKTFLMFAAVSGARPIEICAVRLKDLDLGGNNKQQQLPTVNFRAEYSKMRRARTRYITQELKRQIELWLEIKYRQHKSTVTNPDGSCAGQVWAIPKPKPDDLLFAKWHPDGANPQPGTLYDAMQSEFSELVANVMGQTGAAGWEQDNNRREITLYTCRRFVKTVLSDLGLEQFGEWWIGHQHSVYWSEPAQKIVETWKKKVEPYLTFLDPGQLEAREAEVSSQLEIAQDRYRQLQEQTNLMMRFVTSGSKEERDEVLMEMVKKGYLRP
jgi:integrase